MPENNNTYKRRFIIIIPILIALVLLICTYYYLNKSNNYEGFASPQQILNTPDKRAHEAFQITKNLFKNGVPSFTDFKQKYPKADIVIFNDVKKMHGK